MQEVVLYPVTTAATSFTSAPILLNDSSLVFMQWLLTGSDVAGTASVQVSADNVTWTQLGSNSSSVTSSADGNFNLADVAAKYVRFSWAYTSGTGNISVQANVKNHAVSGVIAR